MSTEQTIDNATGQAVNVDPLVSGDAVHFTRMSSRGTSIKFSTVEGKIVAVSNGVATVKTRNGCEYWVNVVDLRRKGQRTHLTDAFMGR